MTDLSKEARAELLSRIDSDEVRASFDMLVSGIEKLGKFDLVPNILGAKKSLHFKSGSVSYFAFIANRNWLLWYFRRPGVTAGLFDLEALAAIFPAMELSGRSNPAKVEGVLKIRTTTEAAAVVDYVKAFVANRP